MKVQITNEGNNIFPKTPPLLRPGYGPRGGESYMIIPTCI